MSTNNQDNNLSPEQLAERQAAIANNKKQKTTIELPNEEIQSQKLEQQTVAKDTAGNVNVSRGIIGLKTESGEPQPESSYITEGTVADVVMPPSKFASQQGSAANPITEEDLEQRIMMEREKAGMNRERQNWLAIKIRTESQGFKFTHGKDFPEEFKNDPELGETQDEYQKKEPTPNEAQGEQVINVEEQQEQPVETTPVNQQENIKG